MKHRHLIHRNDLDELNEYYVEHHIEKARAKASLPAAWFVWGVVATAFWYFVRDAFFPEYWWWVAYIAMCVISRLAVGFDMGVRVK